MLGEDIFDKKPDFINQEGVKWWKEDLLTDYAQKPNVFNVSLPDIICYAIERLDKRRSFVLVDNKIGTVVEEDFSYESIGIKIDLLKRLKADEVYDGK